MARLIPTGLILAFSTLSGAALAADPLESPWSVREKSVHTRSFDIASDRSSARPDRDAGTRIIAGREVMPNGTIGFGLFGQKSPSHSLGPVTARDMALPKQRKAAVGFSLKF